MMGNHDAGMGPGAWFLMGIGSVALLLLVAISVVLLIRTTSKRGLRPVPARSNARALNLLDAGLARGEVSEDDYRSRRALILDGR